MATGKNNNRYRLNRDLAMTGLVSRRRADELIQAGRIRVNGVGVSDFNCLVDLRQDRLEIDDKAVSDKPHDYVMMNKPKGIVTTMKDEKGRPNVTHLLPVDLRHLRPVGRLDKESEGMLILTNDGSLTQRLTHPSKHVLKLYEITVRGNISQSAIDKVASGIQLSDGMTQPASVRLLERTKNSSRLQVGLNEGKNRQLRRMFAKLGYPVLDLVRVQIGGLQLKELESGRWRRLTADEIASLLSG
jgi:pseudouridine synthase